MPNWVYNSVSLSGNSDDIAKVKEQLNRAYERPYDEWDAETKSFKEVIATFSNPVFSFWNIIAPTDLDTYRKQPDYSIPLNQALRFESDDWYSWNIRNWGTKWDVALFDDEKYPETELIHEENEHIIYRLNTAWSPPIPALEKLSEQYPELTIDLEYEEETGWGGEMVFKNGKIVSQLDYETRCRDCDALNTMEYCENDCGEICSSCKWLGEADLECVAECDIHKIYLTKEFVPDYRLEKA